MDVMIEIKEVFKPMKRIFAAIIAIVLCAGVAQAAVAEESAQATVSATAVPALAAVTPTPSTQPAGVSCETETFTCLLPERLIVMDEATREGFDAAAQADYPGDGRTLLSATDESGSSAITFSLRESSQDVLEAAQEAAVDILGNSESVVEMNYGNNRCAAFACGIEDIVYRLYYLSNGNELLILGASGLEENEISLILSSLTFK